MVALVRFAFRLNAFTVYFKKLGGPSLILGQQWIHVVPKHKNKFSLLNRNCELLCSYVNPNVEKGCSEFQEGKDSECLKDTMRKFKYQIM